MPTTRLRATGIRLGRLLKRITTRTAQTRPADRTYLFLPINGAGLGHLTRCLAVARHLRDAQPDARILFLSTSIAVQLVHRHGFICHHVPPFALSGLDVAGWNRLLASSLEQVIALYRPGVFVFDGSAPYAGLREVMLRHTAIRFLWLRRGCHKPGVDLARLDEDARLFEHLVVPGEPDAATPARAGGPLQVPPITLLDRGDLLSPAEAARDLGLEAAHAAGQRIVYVQLGAGNINDTRDLTQQVLALLAARGCLVVLGHSPIALGEPAPAGNARVLIDYPNSRYFALFDFAVLAGGYNSVCEALAFGLPTLFVPNRQAQADDQLARVRTALPLGRHAVLEEGEQLESALERLLKCLKQPLPAPPTPPENGARVLATLLAELGHAEPPR